MTVISFQGQFAEAVDARTKKQTIRAGKRVYRVGQTLHLYSGGYRPGVPRRKLGGTENPKITHVATIEITWLGRPHAELGRVRVNGMLYSQDQIEALAKADSFADTASFFDYFCPDKRDTFTGSLIHWDWP
jgi:hypothetical protein